MLRRQSVRRVMHRDLSAGWQAWSEMYQARKYAMERLRTCANRLRTPELSDALSHWLASMERARRDAELREMMMREAAAKGASAALESELSAVRAEYDAKLAAMEHAHKKAMERQLIELTGTADQISALRSEQSKEERVELLRRQSMRRVMNSGLSSGWIAWIEMWEAKSYALKRLKDVGNKLRTPAVSETFSYWSTSLAQKRARMERERLEREANSLEAQLRRARFETGQLQLVRVAQEDELRALRNALETLKADSTDSDTGEPALPALKAQAEVMRARMAVLTEDAATANRLRKEAEEDATRQQEDMKRLLDKLLRDQRRKFEADLGDLHKQANAKAKKTVAEERQARVELLRRQVARRMMSAGLSRGWQAWLEMYDARTYALSRLQQAAAFLSKPELAASFSLWMRVWYAGVQKRIQAQAALKDLDLVNAASRCVELQAQIKRMKLEANELKDERDALRLKLHALDGGLAELERQHGQRLAKEKEERLELIRRQSVRRVLYRDLGLGWQAWLELYEARKHAMQCLRTAANRLRAPELADAFSGWEDVWRRGKNEAILAAEKEKARRLRLGSEEISAELEAVKADYEHKLATLAERFAHAEHQLSMLRGSQSELKIAAAEQEQHERTERVELLTRQLARRMKNSDLTQGWAAWHAYYAAHVYAHSRLRQAANRLKSPALQGAFDSWADVVAEEKRMAQVMSLMRQRAGLQSEAEKLELELSAVRAEYDAKLAAMEHAHKKAMERQLIELTGTADQIAALKDERSMEERIEMIKRQVTRRILNGGLSRGWQAWLEMWEAKSYALHRLRDVGNKLRAPECSAVFSMWAADVERAKQLAERQRLEREANSLEAQLRRARFETGQLQLVRVAQEDELRALKARLGVLTDEVLDHDSGLRHVPDLRLDNERLRQLHLDASEAAQTAQRLRLEAEDDIQRERLEHEKLLTKLLAEQRAELEAEFVDLRKQVDARTEEWAKMVRGRHELESTIFELRRELMEQQRSYGEAHVAMQANIQKLSKELVEEKKKPRPQSPKKVELPLPPKKKGGSPLGNVDLDEGPDALPISVQLANALKKGAGKVLDLFRSWDENGDGEVSREEFHLAMPALGLDVPKADIDKLFTEWDSDGGGCIGYKELSKILKAKPVAKSAAPAAAALMAIGRMQGDVLKSKVGFAEKFKKDGGGASGVS